MAVKCHLDNFVIWSYKNPSFLGDYYYYYFNSRVARGDSNHFLQLFEWNLIWQVLKEGFLHLNLQSINQIELYSFSNYLQLSCSTSRFISRYKRLTARGEDQYTVRIDDTSRLRFHFWSQREICSKEQQSGQERLTAASFKLTCCINEIRSPFETR